MTILEALILGLVQGLTEFLPISSSAHLVLTEKLLGLDFPGLAFEVFLHSASLLAVIIFFWKDIVSIVVSFFSYIIKRNHSDLAEFRFGVLLLIATLITGVLGLLLEDFMGDALRSSKVIAFSLFATGIFLILVERLQGYGLRREGDMTIKDAIIVGLAQTLAVIPGISRSGSTLVAALWTGLAKETAIRYSFILSIPVILGSTVLMLPELGLGFFTSQPLALTVSFLASFISALLGIKWLIYFVNKSKLAYFAGYVFFIGILTLIYM
ncbi:undecaprenyl-diphosphatase [Desulfitispora alkaliphila]|uniref:undecaprenyl-diphosphate phosphatase n=1 Tax=Desulfitispora alkaliphila TaxID=622674 RepID=UPI003D2004DA